MRSPILHIMGKEGAEHHSRSQNIYSFGYCNFSCFLEIYFFSYVILPDSLSFYTSQFLQIFSSKRDPPIFCLALENKQASLEK